MTTRDLHHIIAPYVVTCAVDMSQGKLVNGYPKRRWAKREFNFTTEAKARALITDIKSDRKVQEVALWLHANGNMHRMPV